jgi:hypothetical protein
MVLLYLAGMAHGLLVVYDAPLYHFSIALLSEKPNRNFRRKQ